MLPKYANGSKPLKKFVRSVKPPALAVVPSPLESQISKNPLTTSQGSSPPLSPGEQQPKAVPFDQIAGQIQGDGQKQKNKPGRPTKEEVARREAAARAALLPPPPDFSVYGRAAKPYLKIPFHMGATRTGFQGWELDAEEAEAIASGIPGAMQELWPHMQTRYAATWALAGSVLILTGMKAMAYVDWKKAKTGALAQDQGPPEREEPSALQ